MRVGRPRCTGALLGALAAAGCAGPQSVLDHAGTEARYVATLWWTMLGLTGVVWLAIMGVLAFALLRRRHANEEAHHHERARRRGRVIAAATGAVVLMLTIILMHTLLAERATARAFAEEEPLVIDVIGYQWWWDVYYRDPVPARQVRTSNELHLPVGRTVELRVRAADVIHSLWIPNLAGKIDLLPERTNTLRLRAERTGSFRGQCAEFCGIQHAHMALDVVVHDEAEFAAWYAREHAAAREPADSVARRGQEVFLGTSCGLCHMVRGTIANASVGPDLTHIASRRTLAAGTLPNLRGNMAAWILDPQHIKPGTLMPATQLAGEDLNALLHYLETLE